MHQISPETYEWAQEAFIQQLEFLLDDPHGFDDPLEAIAKMRSVAADLGQDFDAQVAYIGTPFEIERLKKLEQRD